MHRRSTGGLRFVALVAVTCGLVAAVAGLAWLGRPPARSGDQVVAAGPREADPGRAAGDRSGTTSTSAVPPSTAPPPTEAPRTGPPVVLVLGDSLVVQSTAALERRAVGLDLEIHAVARTTIGDWLPFAPGLVATHRPDVVVVALGTNDNWPANSGEAAEPRAAERHTAHRARVRALLGQVSAAPCVVWVEPTEVAPMSEYLRYAAGNGTVLREELAAHGAVGVSWTEEQRRGRADEAGWILADGVHLSAAGQEAFAAFIVASVGARC